ncbi:hypothetical protein [Pseudonocardia sp.]|uniref:hypothetical protein n=1 Tax=Pseudonocardia sp. TaxID=60912 RepID=UPI003D1442D1
MADRTVKVELKAKVTQYESSIDRAADKTDNLTAKAERFSKGKYDAKLSIETKAAERAVTVFERRLQSLADKRVAIDADIAAARAKLQQVEVQLDDLRKQAPSPKVDADIAAAEAKIEQIRARIGSLQTARVQVDADTAETEAQLATVQAQMGRIDGSKAKVRVEVDRSLGDSIVQVERLLGALRTLSIPVALVTAAPQIASIGAAAMSATGALGLMPAAGVAAAAAIGAVTVGASGFGDAMKALAKGDVAKFTEELAKLSPEARAAALAVRDLGPAWRETQQATQQALFEGSAEDIRRVGEVYLPILRTGLAGMAGELNDAGRGFAAMATEARTTGDVVKMLDNATKAADRLEPVVVNVAKVLRDVGAVGSEELPELATGFSNATARLQTFVAQARQTGQLKAWIREGIDTVEQLGRITVNVGSILGSVFSAAEASGADFLSTLERITQAVDEFLASAQGQEALTALFTEIRSAVDAAAPGVRVLAEAVAEVVTTLANAGVLTQFAEMLSAVAAGAAPAIENLGELAAVVLPPLLSLLTALGPAIGPVAVGLAAVSVASKGAATVREFATGLALVGPAADKARTSSTTAGTAIVGLGDKAKDADGKTRGLGRTLGLLAIPAALAGAGALLQEIGQEAENATTPLGQVRNEVAELGIVLSTAFSFDFVGIFDEVVDEWSMMIRKFQSGASDAGRIWGEFTREMSGFKMDPIEVRATANTAELRSEMDNAIARVNSSTATVNINGNDAPVGFALRTVLQDIAAGKASVMIDGQPMPILHALDYVMGVINNKTGTVEFRGNTVPVGEALKTLIVEAEGLRPTVPIGATTVPFEADVRDGVGGALAQIGKPMVTVDADTANMLATSAGAKATVEGLTANIPVDGNTAPIDGKIAGLVGNVGTTPLMMPIDGNINPVTGKITQSVALANGLTGTVQIDGNAAPVNGKIEGAVTYAGTKIGTIQIDGNQVPVNGKVAATVTYIDGTTATMQLDANPALAQGKVQQTITMADGSTGTMTLDANPNPANGKITGTVTLANGSTGTITIDGNQTPANGKIQATITYANGSKGTVLVDANTAAATSKINVLKQPTSSTHTVYIKTVGGTAGASGTASGSVRGAGGGIVGYAAGGIVRDPVRRFDRGGVISGYEPGTDRVRAVLSKGEAVLVPELVREIGPQNILAANRRASGRQPTFWSTGAQHFAAGGMAGRGWDRRDWRDRYDDLPRYMSSILRAARGRPLPSLGVLPGTPTLRPVGAAAMPPRPVAMPTGSPDVVRAVATLGSRLAGLDARFGELAEAVREARGITVAATPENAVETAQRVKLALRR